MRVLKNTKPVSPAWHVTESWLFEACGSCRSQASSLVFRRVNKRPRAVSGIENQLAHGPQGHPFL